MAFTRQEAATAALRGSAGTLQRGGQLVRLVNEVSERRAETQQLRRLVDALQGMVRSKTEDKRSSK